MNFLVILIKVGIELADLYRTNMTQMDIVDYFVVAYAIREVGLKLSRLVKLVVKWIKKKKDDPQKN